MNDVKPEQPPKAPKPIDVTELGIVISVKPVQYQNAPPPIVVTELGMLTEVKLLQPPKAQSPIFVTELGMIEFSHPAMSVFVAVSIIVLLLLRES